MQSMDTSSKTSVDLLVSQGAGGWRGAFQRDNCGVRIASGVTSLFEWCSPGRHVSATCEWLTETSVRSGDSSQLHSPPRPLPASCQLASLFACAAARQRAVLPLQFARASRAAGQQQTHHRPPHEAAPLSRLPSPPVKLLASHACPLPLAATAATAAASRHRADLVRVLPVHERCLFRPA